MLSAVAVAARRALATGALSLLFLGTAGAMPIVFDVSDVDDKRGGTFNGRITVEDVIGKSDTVNVYADVGPARNPGITQADILGIFFDVAASDIFAGLVVASLDSDTEIKGWRYDGTTYNADGTVYAGNRGQSPVGNNVNLNGRTFGIDLTIAANDNGEPGGFDQFASFSLAAAGLSSALFADQMAALRVQSIAGVNAFGNSAKATGTAGPVVVTPPTDVPEPGPLALLAIGAFGIYGARRRRSRALRRI